MPENKFKIMILKKLGEIQENTDKQIKKKNQENYP